MKYYKTRQECMKERKKGEVIYYDAVEQMYYKVEIYKRKQIFIYFKVLILNV